MLDKIQFQNGTIVTKEYLNEVQKGSSFSAETSRADFYAEPTSSEHNSWGIGQRDSLKDWEIADPREDNETAIGRLAHDGVVLNSYNTTTLEKVWGPPALVETTAGSGVYGVWVEGGSIVGTDGEPISWSIQFVQLLSGTEINYLYIDEQGARASIEADEAVEISIGSSLPSISQPHVPLAKLTLDANGTALLTNEDGDVAGAGYVDLRPSLYVGNLNTYPQTLRNTPIKTDSYIAKSWERVIADTSNGSLIISLPESPTDSDRIAIVDISGTFDRFPIVVRPGADTKINSSVDDWIINIRDSHLELFYHAATSEWRFEETPGGDCAPVLGTFLSCGGREFIGERLPEECPDGAILPASFPDTPDGVYRYEASTSKCYRDFYPSVAVYANGQGGLIRVKEAPRCNRDSSASASSVVKNIIYVDPATGDDSLGNTGFDGERPFRTLERALIEAVRESRRAGQYNDRYDRVMIELAPGDYYVDNSPGVGSVPALTSSSGLVQRTSTGFILLNKLEGDRSITISIDSLNPTSPQPPRAFNLGRIIYSQSGGVGNIVKVEKQGAGSSIWNITLEYNRGAFNINDELFYDNLAVVNPSSGGLIVPRGISVDGVDLRKVRIRPMYVPELDPVENNPQTRKTAILKVTGGTYVSLLTFTDNPQYSRSHNTVVSVTFASEAEIFGSGNETAYYSKLNSLFNAFDGWGDQGLEAIRAETTIVAPIALTKAQRQNDEEENQTGLPFPDSRTDGTTSYPGPTKLTRQGALDGKLFDLPDINSTRSSSPYVFNCSVRSIFGLSGMWADGSLVSGFKSMVTANFTQVSLQTDPNCYNDQAYYLDPPTNKQDGVGKQYRISTSDPLKYRHYGFRGSSDATIQIVSCFVIGNADHFIAQSGADLSITNSCSDFGDISLRAIGYKARPFSQDEGIASGAYSGTKLLEIIPPLPLSYEPLSNGAKPTLVNSEINSGLVIEYEDTKDYILANKNGNNAPSTIRLYVSNSNFANQFSLDNPPTASDMAFGQFSYTKKVGEEAWELAGGLLHPERKRFYINGFDENGNSILFAGDIVLPDKSAPGFDRLNDRSKIFVWDSVKNSWYVNVTTSAIVEETTDLDEDGYLLKKIDYAFRYKLNPSGYPNGAIFESLDFIFDRSAMKIIRGIDSRTDDERVYKIVLDGYLKEYGIRRPQPYYILEKQVGSSGYPLNASTELIDDPLTVTQIRTYDQFTRPGAVDVKFAGRYVTYLTKGSDARDVFTGNLYPDINNDEPELTEDPSDSITKLALEAMAKRPGISYSANLEPSASPITIRLRSSSTSAGVPVALRRPSVIRASNHTWEWTGYLNYDTAFPTFQGDPLEQDFALGKIVVEEQGGRIYATGMNEEGNYYIGTTVFDLRSGEQFSIPLKADNAPGNVTNQVLNNVIIRSTLLMQDNSQMVFGRGTKIFFSNDTEFKSLTSGDIVASKNPPSVYASVTRAGLVQLADRSMVRGAKGTSATGVSDKAVVTALDLATELDVRFENSVSGGAGISVSSSSIELPGGDPDDPADNITQFLISVDPTYGGFTPVGGIIMWSGNVNSIPNNWALCNGATVNGVQTPDLSNKFIKAVTSNPGQSGGPTISGSTDPTSLEVRQVPRHVHSAYNTSVSRISILGGTNGSTYSNVLVAPAVPDWTGGGGACLTEDYCAPGNQNSLNGEAHSHTFNNVTSVEPAWYSLAFIMRVG